MPAPKDPIKYKEWKEKMSISAKKRCALGIAVPPSRKGIKHTDEAKRKIGKAHKGKIPPKNFELTQQLGADARRGVPLTPEQLEKRKLTLPRGENHWRYIKDRSKLAKRQERNDMAYKEWRMNVYKRDNFKCRIDNCDCSGRIIAHHILGWSPYPELRYEVNNGITLCLAHHPLKRAKEEQMIPVFTELVSQIKVI